MRLQLLSMLATLALLLGGFASASGGGHDDGAGNVDRQITEQIQAAIYKAPALASNDVSVQTHDGVVYLHGIVDTNVQRAEVEAAARAVAGVRRVVNAIELRNDVR